MIGELAGALVEALRSAPELALFLLLGTGYLLGNARLFGFQFGSTAGVLVVALVMGHLGIKIPLNTQSIGFIFFIYCVGLEAGPQFFSSVKSVCAPSIRMGSPLSSRIAIPRQRTHTRESFLWR